ncbi:MAG TPA: hypothetical protein PL193_05565 [Xanthobacteraceae bacterium]|nr:hypothetical protein [Xanthobacteraceae bacterium]
MSILRTGLCAALFVFTPLVAGAAKAAGTAYNVDTSEVADGCKLESWSSFAKNRDLFAALSAACGFELYKWTEVAAQFDRSRAGGDWASAFTPKVKIKLKESDIGVFGLAVSTFGTFDTATGDNTSYTVLMPSTVRVSSQARINLNVGYTRDNVLRRDFLAYGAGIDVRTLKNDWIATFEVFGLAGNSDDTVSRSLVRPRAQVGLRWRPVDAWSADILYGRNLNGENSHWITFATAYRFSIGGK